MFTKVKFPEIQGLFKRVKVWVRRHVYHGRVAMIYSIKVMLQAGNQCDVQCGPLYACACVALAAMVCGGHSSAGL